MQITRLGLVVLALSAAQANAENFSFTKIIDTSAAMPNGPGNFTELSPPVVQDGKIGFIGFASAGPAQVTSGLYTIDQWRAQHGGRARRQLADGWKLHRH